MPTHDVHNIVKTYSVFNTRTITTNTTTLGSIIDTQFYEGLEFLIISGTITDGVYVPVIIGGDEPDLSDGVIVPPSLLIGTTNVIDNLNNQRPSYGVPVTAPIADATYTGSIDSNKAKRIGTHAPYRFYRLDFISTGVTLGGTLTALALLQFAHTMPTPK